MQSSCRCRRKEREREREGATGCNGDSEAEKMMTCAQNDCNRHSAEQECVCETHTDTHRCKCKSVESAVAERMREQSLSQQDSIVRSHDTHPPTLRYV